MQKVILLAGIISVGLFTTPLYAAYFYNQQDESSSIAVSGGGMQLISTTTVTSIGEDFTNAAAYFKFKNPINFCNFGHDTTGSNPIWYFGLRNQAYPTTYQIIWAFSAGSEDWEEFKFDGPNLTTGVPYDAMPAGTYELFLFRACNNGGVPLQFKADSAQDVAAYIVNPSKDFYAQVKNTANGIIYMRDGASETANIIKTLPEDWIMYVASTTDAGGDPVQSDGYDWYQVVDPTDDSTGWMKGRNSTSSVEYLPLEFDKQSSFYASSSEFIASSSRPELVQNIITHYYNNSDTIESLYSSDNNAYAYRISQLKDNDYPLELVMGIAAHENGGPVYFEFDNENVSENMAL